MKRTAYFLMLILAAFLAAVCGAAAQDAERAELDASSLSAGAPFRFTVTVDSDELRSFAETEARLTAVLCPADRPAEECRIMNRTAEGEDSTSLRMTFEVDELPLAGDYTLDISFLDSTGEFETKTAAWVLRGVRDGEASGEGTEDPAVTETKASGEGTEDPALTEAGATEEGEAAPVAEAAAPEDGEAPEPETAGLPAEGDELPAAPDSGEAPALPETVKKVVLRPEVRDAAGTPLIYGSTVYVNDPYTLLVTADSPMNDSVMVEAELPATLLSAPLDPDSECFRYMGPEGTALRVPGGLFSAENGNAFSCSFRYSAPAWLAANPLIFSMSPNPDNRVAVDETYEMDRVAWTNYPVNITRYAATHQVQISDSRGNLLCSDTVPCAVFSSEDVYVFTYKFPADWSAASRSGMELSADVSWPAAWAYGISADDAMASQYGNPCTPDAEGKTRLTLTETAPGRYSASCTFVPSGVTAPAQQPALVHLDDASFAVNDLNVYMPGRITKSEAVLRPSLTLRMAENDAPAEQIRAGQIGTLYRSPSDRPNSSADPSLPALYTLKADISGVSAARSPQPGDTVSVTWNMLDELANTGDLPACLTRTGSGYILGDLEQTSEGNWQASCDLRFPQTMTEQIRGGTLSMQLNSGVYQTNAQALMNNSFVFAREKLSVDLDVPVHMLLRQPTEFHVRLTDAGGNFSDYLRAVLSYTGASLRSDWIYNYTTTCQGDYLISVDGDSTCSAFFDQPVETGSDMHFDLISPALDYLFSAEYKPAADIHIEPVTPVRASLSVKLMHDGTEIPLPADEREAFVVSDDYQLQFTLMPDPEFRDVVNAVSVDGEGKVLDWWEPLLIRWEMIPGGQTGLNFYRDGDHFTARYDFSFTEGNHFLSGNMARLVMEPGIEGWDIDVQGDWAPISLPSRIDRKPLELSISDFTIAGSEETVGDLHVNEEASFTVSFSGAMEYYDPSRMMIGYDANGIRTPLPCDADYSAGTLTCRIIPQCTDYDTSGNYGTVCGTNLNIYAVYNGDSINQAAEAAQKTFSVKRNDIYFTAVAEGSLSADDMVSVRAATEDMTEMAYGSVDAGEWGIDSFLPRQIRDHNGSEYRSYPVNFRFEASGGAVPDETRMFMDVTYETGTRSTAEEHVISLRPRSVAGDTVMFELDFGSYELADDGRTIREALEDAVTIKALTVRYTGDSLLGAASAKFEAEGLTFALKVATLFELETDLSIPNILQFGGPAAPEALMQTFTVYCSQLWQPLECSADAPVEDLQPVTVPVDFVSSQDGEQIPTGYEMPSGVSLGFRDDGCWGKIRTQFSGMPMIYVNNAVDPVCYLTAWNGGKQVWIATNAK